MSVECTSRTGKRYYLHVKPTAPRKPNYFFSTEAEGQLALAVPDGYEVYENANGQVFLRRRAAQTILPAELALVESALHKYGEAWRYWVEVKKNAIVVHHAGETDGIDRMLASFGRGRMSDADKRRFASYMAMLRFTLINKKARVFVVERFCFRGSVDDWIPLAGPGTLGAHVRRFVKHLGRESFYELF